MSYFNIFRIVLLRRTQVAWVVEVAVGDGFHDVVGEDVVAALKVGDGAGAVR